MKPTIFNLTVNTRENDGETIAEIDINGIIGFDWWASEDEQNTKEIMQEQLREIRSLNASRIIVNISSLGGDVDHGLAIHDLLAANSAEVETNVIGMTASAATIIAQAGDVRKMSDNALYLVHRAWTMGMGNANDFEALAGDLVKLDDRISNIYAKRSGKTKEEFLDLMNESNGDGIWITADEAEEFGLIDEIVEPMKAAAAVDPGVFDQFEIPKPPENGSAKEPAGTLSYDVNLNLQVNGTPYTGNLEDLKREMEKTQQILNGETDVIVETNDSNEAEQATGGVSSRNRNKLVILKLKSKNYG